MPFSDSPPATDMILLRSHFSAPPENMGGRRMSIERLNRETLFSSFIVHHTPSVDRHLALGCPADGAWKGRGPLGKSISQVAIITRSLPYSNSSFFFFSFFSLFTNYSTNTSHRLAAVRYHRIPSKDQEEPWPERKGGGGGFNRSEREKAVSGSIASETRRTLLLRAVTVSES